MTLRMRPGTEGLWLPPGRRRKTDFERYPWRVVDEQGVVLGSCPDEASAKKMARAVGGKAVRV